MSAHKQCKSKNGFQLRSVQPEQIIIQKACAIPLQLFEVLENFAQASFCPVLFFHAYTICLWAGKLE